MHDRHTFKVNRHSNNPGSDVRVWAGFGGDGHVDGHVDGQVVTEVGM